MSRNQNIILGLKTADRLCLIVQLGHLTFELDLKFEL